MLNLFFPYRIISQFSNWISLTKYSKPSYLQYVLSVQPTFRHCTWLLQIIITFTIIFLNRFTLPLFFFNYFRFLRSLRGPSNYYFLIFLTSFGPSKHKLLISLPSFGPSKNKNLYTAVFFIIYFFVSQLFDSCGFLKPSQYCSDLNFLILYAFKSFACTVPKFLPFAFFTS